MKQIIVIGGGAAGMMAAYTAAKNGHAVTLIEKNEKLGKKIYITGKGRCNVTNACDFDALIANMVSNPRFMYSSLRAFSNWDMYALLEKQGCPLKIERGDRVFPASDHASDVTRALQVCLKEAGVRVLLHTEAKEIRDRTCCMSAADRTYCAGAFERTEEQEKKMDAGKRFAVETVGTAARERQEKGQQKTGQLKKEQREVFFADAVIVCTGGYSYQSTGSTGDGYRFAKELGLFVETPVPALVPLSAQEHDCKELQGVSLKNVGIGIYRLSDKARKKAITEDFGEMLFTHFGISGPVILSASSKIAKALTEGERFVLSIDLKPALSEEKLDERILRDFSEAQNMNLENALSKLLLSSLRPVILGRAKLDPKKKVHDVSREERLRLVRAVKGLDFTINGTRGFQEAIITQGGVSVKEVNPKTMEAKKVPGLYFAGEVLDVDAYTGGFNLQVAWSTGYAAGMGASEE